VALGPNLEICYYEISPQLKSDIK
jgi:hypothetical protein